MTAAWRALAGQGLDPQRVERLLTEHRGSPAAVLRRLGVPEDPGEAERSEAAGIDFLLSGDSRFPDDLTAFPGAPRWLYVRGPIPAGPRVALVGSRQASGYGLRMAEDLGRLIGGAGWPVVSGLARGIDAAAHRGSLEAGGGAVAVLGCGVDVWYPRANARLGEEILAAGGCVLSEFPPGASPEPWRFPARNRIISGLASVLVVVEAALRSGALITARHALDQGREVFAVPGDLGRSTSEGTNMLIRDGAHPITDLASVVEMVELVVGPAPNGAGSMAPPGEAPEVAGVVVSAPVLLDELIARSGRPASEVLAGLGPLELAGRLRMTEGWVVPS